MALWLIQSFNDTLFFHCSISKRPISINLLRLTKINLSLEVLKHLNIEHLKNNLRRDLTKQLHLSSQFWIHVQKL